MYLSSAALETVLEREEEATPRKSHDAQLRTSAFPPLMRTCLPLELSMTTEGTRAGRVPWGTLGTAKQIVEGSRLLNGDDCRNQGNANNRGMSILSPRGSGSQSSIRSCCCSLDNPLRMHGYHSKPAPCRESFDCNGATCPTSMLRSSRCADDVGRLGQKPHVDDEEK